MKKKLTFYFDEEDDDRFMIYSHALDMHSSLWNIAELIRSKLKYANMSDDCERHLIEISELIYLPDEG